MIVKENEQKTPHGLKEVMEKIGIFARYSVIENEHTVAEEV